MDRSTAEVLKAAREKIAKPEVWTKGASARRDSGAYTGPRNADAVCWCSVGAIAAVTDDPTAGWSYLSAAAPNTWDVAAFNDHPATTHADVLAVFDKAIALAEQEQA